MITVKFNINSPIHQIKSSIEGFGGILLRPMITDEKIVGIKPNN